jgi:hypothetical protein
MIPRTLWEYWWARGNGPAAPAPPAGTVPLVLEPTGFLRPEAVSRSMQQEEQAQTLLEADGQLGGARKWFHYTYGQRSKFYQTGQILFTDEYISGSGISGVDNSMPDASSSSSGLFVCFALCRPSSTPGQDPTVGVEFDELVRGDLQQVLLWSEPAINQEELACIRDNLRDAHPMPPLVWPEETATTTPDALQQDLQRRLDELTRLTSEDSGAYAMAFVRLSDCLFGSSRHRTGRVLHSGGTAEPGARVGCLPRLRHRAAGRRAARAPDARAAHL